MCVGLGSPLSGGSALSGPTRDNDFCVGYLFVNANEFVSHTCALRVPIFLRFFQGVVTITSFR